MFKLGPIEFAASYGWLFQHESFFYFSLERSLLFIRIGALRLWIEDTRYTDVEFCSACDAEEGDEGPSNRSYGDESLTVCGACRSVEQGTYTKRVRI
jgi:hypothetical protein